MYPESGDDPEAYHTPTDADTLQKAQEIQSDKKRHKAAMDHLSERNTHGVAAEKSARKQLEKKTKGRLKATFQNKEESPFQAEAERDNEEAQSVEKED